MCFAIALNSHSAALPCFSLCDRQVGMVACNDYILLECCIYRILKFHFSGSAAYGQLLELFLEVRQQ